MAIAVKATSNKKNGTVGKQGTESKCEWHERAEEYSAISSILSSILTIQVVKLIYLWCVHGVYNFYPKECT